MASDSQVETTLTELVEPSDFHLQLQGNHETQVSEGEEADIHKHFADCKKNPGHENFIPVKTFKMQDLPEDYKDHDMYKFIKASAKLTVRLGVKMTSPHRPAFYKDGKTPYPFYEMRNQTTLRLGTGNIAMCRFIDSSGDETKIKGDNNFSKDKVISKTCPCTKCKTSDKRNNVWWEFLIFTSTHVVFDEVEAIHTSCRLFFDDQNSPSVFLDKVSVCANDVEEDWCRLIYVTCDQAMGDKLYNLEKRRRDIGWTVVKKFKDRSGDDPLIFIISHPHGCYKHISLGRIKKTYKVQEFDKNIILLKLTYTAGTCPGSSGAKVCFMKPGHTHQHSGALKSGTNFINFSCVGVYRTGV